MTEGGDELQFDKAEFVAAPPAPMVCASCKQIISRQYWELDGNPICEACKPKLEAAGNDGTSASRFFRALGAGSVAGAVGAGLWYAVVAITDYEIGLIAIVVGVLVGGAVRWGSHGRGGWFYQTLAIGLTYVAITSTYIPLILKELKGAAPEALAGDVSGTGVAGTSSTAFVANGLVATTTVATATIAAPPMSGGLKAAGFVVGGIFLLALAMAAPILAGFENAIGILIIGFALYEAWKINKRVVLTFGGPFPLGAIDTDKVSGV